MITRSKPSRQFTTAVLFALGTAVIAGLLIADDAKSARPVDAQILSGLFVSVFPLVFGRAAWKKRPRRTVETTYAYGDPTQQKTEALLDIGKTEQALLGAKQLLATNPDDIGANETLARALLASGSHREARDVATQALQLDPASIVALHVRALANARLGDRQKSLADLSTAISVEPTNAALLNELALFHLDSHEASFFQSWTRPPFISLHLKKAIQATHDGLTQHPNNIGLLCTRSTIELLQGLTKQSKTTALLAASADPSSSAARYRVSCAQLASNEVEVGVRAMIGLVTQDQSYGRAVAWEFDHLVRRRRQRRQIPAELRPKVELVRRNFRR